MVEKMKKETKKSVMVLFVLFVFFVCFSLFASSSKEDVSTWEPFISSTDLGFLVDILGQPMLGADGKLIVFPSEYPIYLKIIDPKIIKPTGAEIKSIPISCFSEKGCDINKVVFSVESKSQEEKPVKQIIVPNTKDGKISLTTEYGVVLYLNKELVLDPDINIFMAVIDYKEEKEVPIPLKEEERTINLSNGYYYSYDSLMEDIDWGETFIEDYMSSDNSLSSEDIQGFLFIFDAPIKNNLYFWGKIDGNFVFAEEDVFLPQDYEYNLNKKKDGGFQLCPKNCIPEEKQYGKEKKGIMVLEISCDCKDVLVPNDIIVVKKDFLHSFKSKITYDPVFFYLVTYDLCMEKNPSAVNANVRLKESNINKISSIMESLDWYGIPYKLKINPNTDFEAIWDIKVDNEKLNIKLNGNYKESHSEIYFPYSELVYIFNVSDGFGGGSNFELTKQGLFYGNLADFNIICTYLYPEVKIQIK